MTLPLIPPGATLQYNNYAQLNYPPFETVLWVTYNAPDPDGISSNYQGQLINYYYISSEVGAGAFNTPTGPASGDLGGFYPNPLVVGIDGYAINQNSIPQAGYVLTYFDGYVQWEAGGGGAPSGPAGGDLSGTYPNPSVVKIQGIAVSATAPTNGQVLEYNGTSYVPVTPSSGVTWAADLAGSTNTSQTVHAIQGVVISGTPSSGYVLEATASNAAHWATPPASPPTGSAGGDLGGTYPNPTVLSVAHVTTGVLPAANQAAQTMGGDVSGTTASATVVGIEGKPIVLTSLATNNVLQYNGTDWVNVAPPGGPPTGSAGGDLSGNYPNPTVVKIDGASVPAAGSLTTGNVLQVNGTSSLTYAPVNLAGGSNYVTGSLPTGNQASQNLTLTGDVTGSGTTAGTTTTVAAIQGVTISGTPSSGQVLKATSSSAASWAADPATVTWADDLSGNGTTTNTAQYISSISYSSSSAGGNIVINGTNTGFKFAAGNAGPYINQTSTSTASGSNFAIQAQSATGSGHNGGELILSSGTSGSATAGSLLLQTGGTTQITVAPTLVTIAPAVTMSNYGTGILHSSSVGAITSSAVVTGDITPGTSGQVLMSNATPATTWTTLSGDMTVGATGTTTVAKINGASIPASGSLTTGNVLQVSGSSALTYAPVNLAGGANYVTGTLPAGNIPSLSGDVTGSITSNTVGKIQGNTVTSGALTEGQFLIATSTSNWAATSLSGDVTESATTPGKLTVGQLQGSIVLSGTPSTGQVLTATSSTAASWAAGPATVTWAQDLSTSTNTAQYVSSISGANGNGGIITIYGNGADTYFQFSSGSLTPGINQASISTGSGANMTIQAQGATGGSHTGGNLVLEGGTSGSANAGYVQFGSSLVFPSVTKTGTYSILFSDYYILCNPSSGFTVTLPTPTKGLTFVIKDISGTAETNNITIAQNASENIENVAASYLLTTNFGYVKLMSDGTNWWKVN
jgi:hypothetical protein